MARKAYVIELHDPDYTPAQLFEAILEAFEIKNLSHLAEELQMDHAPIYKICNRKTALSGDVMLRVMDYTGWSLEKVRELSGTKKICSRDPGYTKDIRHRAEDNKRKP